MCIKCYIFEHYNFTIDSRPFFNPDRLTKHQLLYSRVFSPKLFTFSICFYLSTEFSYLISFLCSLFEFHTECSNVFAKVQKNQLFSLELCQKCVVIFMNGMDCRQVVWFAAEEKWREKPQRSTINFPVQKQLLDTGGCSTVCALCMYQSAIK